MSIHNQGTGGAGETGGTGAAATTTTRPRQSRDTGNWRGWYISGAFKPNKIIGDREARAVIDAWNADPKHKDLQVEYDFPRESGKIFNAETMQLEEPSQSTDETGARFSFSKSREEFDATRDRAVAEDGIVMPGLNEAEVEVTLVKPHDFNGKRPISQAKAWAKEHLVTKKDKNGNYIDMPKLIDGTPYIITVNGVKEYLSQQTVEKTGDLKLHLSVLKQLKEVISRSIEGEIHASRKKDKGGHRSIKNGIIMNQLVHRYYGAVSYNGDVYIVKTTIIEERDGDNRAYTYEVTDAEIELAEVETSTKAEPMERTHIGTANLLRKVKKSNDSGDLLLVESAKTTENGEDIRFSVGEESQKIFDTAKRKFGETKDIREAGYVLPDGSMLDFSGRHELDPGTDSSFLAGRRATDHRAINQISFVYDENGDEVDTGVSSDMPDFIKRGAIRIDNNAGLINLSTAPTSAQKKVLRQLIAENGGDVQVDFGDGWDSDHYVEYDQAKSTRVLGDIDRYFDEGIKPQSNARFSLSLGAPYQGSKGQIATRVVDALPRGRRFVDLFTGGGAVTHAAMLSGKYGEYRVNDINPAGLELFLKGINGDYRDYIPREMSAEEFKQIKGTPEGLMLSYGGLGRNVGPDKESVARRVRRVQRLEDLKPYADQVESSNSDNRDVELEPGDVVYADIPYEGTNKTGYRKGARFDKQAFSDWGLAQDVPVYVSEQSMPKGWVEVASWEMPSMNAQKKRGEKLFVQERFAGEGGRGDGRVNNATYRDNADARFSLSTEDQERQIHSENFKRWFGDWENDPENASKVVDEKGRPLVVFHANREGSGFYEFDTSVKRNRINMGSHFGTATQAANIALDGESDGYNPKTYAVYLDIKNPLEVVDFFADDNAYWANLLVKLVNENNINDPKINDVIAKMKEKWPWIDGNDDSLWADDNYEQRNDSKYQFDDIPELYNALRDVAERLGYDGFVYENQIEGDGLSYVAFRPEQIKSATENNGDFSRENPDIRFSYSVEDANEFVGTFTRRHAIKEGLASYHAVDGEESLERLISTLGLEEDTADVYRYRYNNPDCVAFNDPDRNIVVVFTHKHDSLKEVDLSALHELVHLTYGQFDQAARNRFVNAIVRHYRSYPKGNKFIDKLHHSYDSSQWATETMAYYYEKRAKEFGIDELLSGEVDLGNEELNNFVAQINSILTDKESRDEQEQGIEPAPGRGRRGDRSDRTSQGEGAEARFSLSGDGTVEEYNRAVNMTGRTFNVGGREVKPGLTRYNFQEAFQDAILAVKKLQQVVERHFGIKLPTRENAWMYENRLSSINMHERKSFIKKVYEPMMKIADRIMKRGVKDFGLERMERMERMEGNTRKKRLPHGEMRQPSSTEMNIWLRSDGHFNCIDIAAATALNDIDAA